MLDTANIECWERERTVTPVRAFAVRLHATGCCLEKHKKFSGYSAFNALIRWFLLGTSSSWQRSRPVRGEAQVSRSRRNRCQNQWRTVLVVYCNRPRHQVDFACRSVWTTRHRSSLCSSPWAVRETRPLRGRVSRRWLRLSDCPCLIRTQRSAWLCRSKPDQKMVSDA